MQHKTKTGRRWACFAITVFTLLALAGCKQDLMSKLSENDANEMLGVPARPAPTARPGRWRSKATASAPR
jgi:hypothetical protein